MPTAPFEAQSDLLYVGEYGSVSDSASFEAYSDVTDPTHDEAQYPMDSRICCSFRHGRSNRSYRTSIRGKRDSAMASLGSSSCYVDVDSFEKSMNAHSSQRHTRVGVIVFVRVGLGEILIEPRSLLPSTQWHFNKSGQPPDMSKDSQPNLCVTCGRLTERCHCAHMVSYYTLFCRKCIGATLAF